MKGKQIFYNFEDNFFFPIFKTVILIVGWWSTYSTPPLAMREQIYPRTNDMKCTTLNYGKATNPETSEQIDRIQAVFSSESKRVILNLLPSRDETTNELWTRIKAMSPADRESLKARVTMKESDFGPFATISGMEVAESL